MATSLSTKENRIKTTVVTAGDKAFAWGTLLLVASMRRNGMKHPVIVGMTGWSEIMKQRVLSLGDVTLHELPKSRQCVTCQKPMLMALEDIETEWVCWADSDALFVGDCSEWLTGDDENEIVIRKYNPKPSDFTPDNLETWRRDVEHFFGKALSKSRYDTRMNAPFIVLHRKWRPFLDRWKTQIENVLPDDVGIIMKHGSPYFQTDESVLGSLLCFDPDAPLVTEHYKANGSVDKNRYYAHIAYNPKPWQMWNSYSVSFHELIQPVVDWLLEKGIVRPDDLPLPLRRNWWQFCRIAAPLAPWVWRAMKLKRRIFKG
ncbi:MAG: hypothetical protein J6X55_12425 [Victivallales bacterium]|nr:hypothetical protein [Victivallales bacterium]